MVYPPVAVMLGTENTLVLGLNVKPVRARTGVLPEDADVKLTKYVALVVVDTTFTLVALVAVPVRLPAKVTAVNIFVEGL